MPETDFVSVFSFVGHTMNGCEICLMIISYILFVCTIPFSLCVCIKVSYLIYYLSHFPVCLRVVHKSKIVPYRMKIYTEFNIDLAQIGQIHGII